MKRRVLVCGVGSIGERHLRNLLALGQEELAVFRSRLLPLRTIEREFPTYTDLDAAIAEFCPEAAFITNPSAMHLSVALRCAQSGCHLFIEKPVSHRLEGLGELKAVCEQHDVLAMVGYMLRFHPLFQRVKQWLGEGATSPIGKPVSVRSSWGEHVADWHPWEDYRQSYAVRKDLGGGPALTLSHDIDLLVWMFGEAKRVIGLPNRAGDLETECEHGIDLLLGFEGGVTANVHLDYLQRPPQRSWGIVGTRGRATVDVVRGRMEVFTEGQSEEFAVPEGFDRNDLFMAEARYFLECLDSNTRPSSGIAEAGETVRIALEALKD